MAGMARDDSNGAGGVAGGNSGRSGVPGRGTGGTRASSWVALAGLVVAAFAVRYLYVAQTEGVPFVRQLAGDAKGYYEWAARIAGGEWVGDEAFYQAPLYPYTLAVVFRTLGESVACLRMTQIAWGALGTVLLAAAARRMFDGRAGVVAGAMAALYAPAIFFDGIVQKASLSGLLICGLMWALARAGGGRIWRAAGVGIVAGLVVLTRENALIWLPILGAWLWMGAHRVDRECPLKGGHGANHELGGSANRRPRGLWAVGAFVAGLGLVLGPVGMRNAAVCGEWSFSTFQAGPNFYIGNHAGASGRYEPLVRGHETPEFERADATKLAQAVAGRELSPREVSDYWMSRTWQDIGSDVPGWLRLCAVKMLMVWNRYEVGDVESQYVYAQYAPVLQGLGSVWHFGALCPLAAVGVVATRREWRRLWVWYALILSMAGSVALFYVLARYRYPLVPLLIPFAAAGCVQVWDGLRRRDVRRLALPIGMGLVAAVVSNLRIHDEARLDALARMNVGVALAREGNLPAATEHFAASVRLHPGSAEGRNNLAQALAMQGRFGAAIEHYEAALSIESGLLGVDYNLGVALERVGRLDAALGHYRRAVDLDPSDVEARRAIERLQGE